MTWTIQDIMSIKKKPQTYIVEILRLGYTLKIKVLRSTNSGFSPATQRQLKIILKAWPKYSKKDVLDKIF